MSFDIGGEKKSTKNTKTVKSSIDQEGLDYLFKSALESDELTNILGADNASGIYNSATEKQLAGAYVARKAGEVASRNTTVTQTEGSKSGGGSAKIGTVLCTHYMREGMLSQNEHSLAATHASNVLSRAHLRGYHFWACAVVEMLRAGGMRARILHAIFYPITCAWVGYLAGTRKTLLGYFTWYVMRPMCWLIGKTVAREEQDWYRLYRTREG